MIAPIVVLAVAAAAQARPPSKPSPFQKGAILTRSATASGSGDQNVVTATARCPKSKRDELSYAAVGGGFQESVPNLNSEGFVFQSQMVGHAGWKASTQIRNFSRSSNDPVSITSYVYCALGALKPVTSSTTSSTGGALGTTPSPLPEAGCGGRHPTLLGGGFSFSLPVNFQDYIVDSYRSLEPGSGPDAWTTRLFGSTPVGQLTTEAYCSADKSVARKQKIALKTSDSGAPSFTPQTVDAACKDPKSRPTMGGFLVNGVRLTSALFVYESYRLGKKWRVSGSYQHTASDTGPIVLGSLSYC
jgi:hypothetical protein